MSELRIENSRTGTPLDIRLLMGSAALSRRVWAPRYWLVFASAYALLYVGGPVAGAMIYVGAALWAFRGPFAIVQALTISWLVTTVNPGILAEIPGAAMLRILVITAASAAVILYAFRGLTAGPSRALRLLAFFCGAAALSSAFTSYALDVSLFKIASFYAGALSVIVAMQMAMLRGAPVERWFKSLILTVVLVSLPLIATDLGYLRNERGFQGLLNQPQAYGILLAVAVAWLAAEIWFGRKRDVLHFLGLGVALISLIASGSRTAAIAVALAFTVGFVVRIAVKGEIRRWSIALLIGGVATAAVFAVQPVRTAVLDFAFKGNIAQFDSAQQAFGQSRGLFIERSFQGFLEHPVFGIGFGVASEGQPFIIERDPYFGLPISASVEKGFAFVALLEETGIAGTVLFMFFLIALFKGAARDSRPILLIGALAVLLTNFGESTLFSLGGMGLFVWLMLAMFATKANQPKGQLIAHNRS